MRVRSAALAVVVLLAAGSTAQAAGPAPLSADHAPAIVNSSYGSGDFGRWLVDPFDLPAFRYRINEARAPMAAQPELAGGRQAQHQVGNDHIKGMAWNDGYTELWSQDRLSQWANLYQASSNHFAGGYGYLNVDGRPSSTLYLDRPAHSGFTRTFGVGYYRRTLRARGIGVSETVYAPFGNDPVLLDDVTLRNRTSKSHRVSWFEYWDVNPYDQTTGFQRNIGLLSPVWKRRARILSVAQETSSEGDTDPLSIFAAPVRGPLAGYETSVEKFFGSGSRGRPSEVAKNRLSNTISAPAPDGQAGDTLFVLRAPVVLKPGHSVTLRYVYGMAHPAQIAKLVARYRRAPRPFRASERAWAAYLPKASFGRGSVWVSRELDWDAYLLRSATVYEEACGYHTITQGGYYEYTDGANLGYRSWPHYMLPMAYSDPYLARQIIQYSVNLQPPPPGAQNPYGTGPLCQRVDLGTSNDLDFWLLLAAGEYGLGTRDTRFFNRVMPYYDTQGKQKATIWQHLKVAFAHQESLLGPHGDYTMGSTGDWSDFSTEFEHMTESTLVTAQCAYAYPKLAELADLRGDHAFARQLRAAGARDLATVRREWAGKGWYLRGWAGATQVGRGVIFEEPQPWAILAGAPRGSQAKTLVSNIRRFLDGVGAPHRLGGPARFGSTQVPAYDDPGVTEHAGAPALALIKAPNNSPIQNADEWPGGVWFDLNGWLTWSYGALDGVVRGARRLAWSEYTRNTLANHARIWPRHWDGTISVDDVCYGYYSPHPSYCGNGLGTSYEGQITEQPTWMVMNAIHLAGLTPVRDGYDVIPHLPMRSFSLRLPDMGVAQGDRVLRGYVRAVQGGSVVMHVALPPGARLKRLRTYAAGRLVAHSVRGRLVVFRLPTRAGRAANWAVVG
ncbi:MAG: GH36-type glycosyl hydrolase domain-containing protein [Solirubrobacteraceae bacterium]